MSKGSTQVKAPDPFEIAEADVLFNRINQFTPLNSLQYFGPERNTAVETLNPALQDIENRRLMSDRMLMDMALSRQGDMKGGALPSLVPGLTLGDSGYGPTDPAANVPYVPDFIGGFQGQPQATVQGNPKGGVQPQAAAPAQAPAKGGMPQAYNAGQVPMPGQFGGQMGAPMNAAQAQTNTGFTPSAGVQRDLDQWMDKWAGGSDSFGDNFADFRKFQGNFAGGALADKLFGSSQPKRGSLPGTEWERGPDGKILGNKGTGHWNPYLNTWVDRRGRPVKNQRPGPNSNTGAPQQSPQGGQKGGMPQPSPQPQAKGGAQQAPPAAHPAKGGAQQQSMPSQQQSLQDMQMGIQGGLEQAVFDRNYGLIESKLEDQQQRLYQDLANRGIPRDSDAGRREIMAHEQSRGNLLAGMSQDAVQQGITAQLQNANMISANRATQFNELASLLGLNQVAQPGLQNFFAPANADVTGAFALNQQAQATNANNATQMKTGMMDAAGSLGGAGIMASDRRLKRNIEKVGKVNGHNWYKFEFINGTKAEGVMADEMPAEFVVPHPSGYDMVDYGKVFTCHR